MEKAIGGRFDIEKFDGKRNFELWKLKVRDVMIQLGQHKALLGREQKPEDMSDEDWSKKKKMSDSEWEDLDTRAASTIRLYLSDHIMFNVKDEKTAAGLWRKLEGLYQAKSLVNRILLKKRLYSLKMKEGTKVSTHLNEFNTILSELESIDVRLDEEDKAVTLLCTLPESYDSLVLTLSCSKEKLTLDDVVTALLSTELRRSAAGEGGEEDEETLALVYRGRSGEGGRSSKNRSKIPNGGKQVVCWSCGKKGHKRKDCWSKKNDGNDPPGNKQGGETNYAGESIPGYYGEAFNTGVSSVHHGSWILDSGATHHMCSHRSWFASYDKCDSKYVTMGNGSTSKVEGIGRVHIKMHDGVVRTLGKVLHVPGLKRNLVSLCVLDSEGHRFTGCGGGIKILKGALVVMEGARVGNLYKLTGATMTPGAGLSSVRFKQNSSGGGVSLGGGYLRETAWRKKSLGVGKVKDRPSLLEIPN